MNKPNVLFIISDQHSAKQLGCEDRHRYGNSDFSVALTPNLDRMAANGVRFRNAICQSPICTPSRVCWISGQYAHNTGYYGLSGRNPNGLPTIFGHFRNNGYTTGMVGKVHCPEYWVEDDCDLFLESVGTSIGGKPEYAAYLRSHDLNELEKLRNFQDFSGLHGQPFEGRPSDISYEDSNEGWTTARAREFMLDAKQKEKPFFIQVSFQKPHECYTPSRQFWDLYRDEELVLPPSAMGYDMKAAHKAPHMIKMSETFQTGQWTLLDPKTHQAGKIRKLHGYLGNVSQVDYAVGELLDFLEENGLAEDTIVVYSSDHGDYAAEHDLMEKAPGICGDSITRVPMIWQWKGHFPEGIIQDQIVETVDFSQTVCNLCGLPPLETSDGAVITGLLNGGNETIHDCGLTEFAWSKSIRMGDYRLVWYPEEMFREEYPEGFGELYYLKTDPWEMENLWFHDENQDVVARMTRKLLDRIVTTTRPATVLMINPPKSNQTIDRYTCRTNRDGKFSILQQFDKNTPKNYL